jgi:hypothetical protein
MQSNVAMARECALIPDAEELRKRAAWDREIAERTGNPTIWAMRLHTAEKLEAEDRVPGRGVRAAAVSRSPAGSAGVRRIGRAA